MATYEEIYGKRVEVLDADPTLNSSYEGQVWYNSATGTLKTVVSFSAWSSGSSVITARYGTSGAGTQTAGLMIAGNSSSTSDTYITNTEEYNGSGWGTGGALPTGTRSGAGFGTQTAALYAGGYDGSNTAEAYTYNGTAWTGIPALNTARRSLDNMGAGTTTAAIVAGGYIEPPYTAISEEFNGSSWSEGDNLNTDRANAAAAGIQTAAFMAGGNTPPETGATENYDGTSWTNSGSLNTARRLLGGGGSQTDGIVFGGYAPPGNQNLVENYDGTSWTANPATLATARHGGASGSQPGAASSTFYASGYSPSSPEPLTGVTEEFTKSVNTVTAAAWAAGGNLNTARSLNATATNAPQDAGLTFGGNWPSVTADTEEYNGTTWAEQTNLPQALTAAAGAGTQTAGLCTTGRTPGGRLNNTYEYDGSSWTAGGNYTATQAYTSGAGTQTAGLAVGGETPPGTDLTTSSEYNGSSWTAGNACNTPGYLGPVFGSAAGAIYSCVSGPPTSLESEAYDGTNWTAGPTTIFSNNQGGGAGTFPTGIIFGGPGTPPASSTQGWDGSTWSTRPSLGTARRAKGAGTSAGGLAMGGETPSSPTSNSTEEFTPESTAVNAKTLTTS